MAGHDPERSCRYASHPANQPIRWTASTLVLGAPEHGLRCGGRVAVQRSYVLRYDGEDTAAPSTAFARRFEGIEHLVSLYAMAARQADPLTEYLCLYRLLEGKDKTNGKTFASGNIERLAGFNYGNSESLVQTTSTRPPSMLSRCTGGKHSTRSPT